VQSVTCNDDNGVMHVLAPAGNNQRSAVRHLQQKHLAMLTTSANTQRSAVRHLQQHRLGAHPPRRLANNHKAQLLGKLERKANQPTECSPSPATSWCPYSRDH
jgi:hypothetical protein